MQFLIQGDRGVWVEYLQLALTTERDIRPGLTAFFGERTCQALKDFTENTDVCTVNREVWEKLNPYLTGYRGAIMIEKGDTVFGLSRRYGTTEEAIPTANPIDPDDLVVDAI